MSLQEKATLWHSQLTSYDDLTNLELEAALLEQLQGLAHSLSLPDTCLAEDTRRWRAMSAYQKSVRRHDIDTALRSGCALFRYDASLLLWRMSVIMLEDVGLANPLLGALGLVLLGHHNTVGDGICLQWAMQLTLIAASGPNDRTLDHATILARQDPGLAPFRELCRAMVIDRPSTLVEIYRDAAEPLAHRVIAGLGLTGILDSSQRNESHVNRNNLATYLSMIEEMDLPRIIKFIAAKGAELCISSHPCLLPLVWRAAIEEPLSVQEGNVAAAPMIAGLPSVVFDMHVPEGREAIAIFTDECTDLLRLLENYSREERNKLIGVTLFNNEGGDVLRMSLTYPTGSTLLKLSQAAHLSGYNMTRLQDQRELSDIVMRNIAVLDDLRKKVCAPCKHASLI